MHAQIKNYWYNIIKIKINNYNHIINKKSTNKIEITIKEKKLNAIGRILLFSKFDKIFLKLAKFIIS